MREIYSGLYECTGHVVPYLVLVKIGKPTERARPGNRGKRNSRMLLMHFLNKVRFSYLQVRFYFFIYIIQVHFNSLMNPLELEMYHQIKNVIGVDLTFYEYLFMADADTTDDPLSVNSLISVCLFFLAFTIIHWTKMLGRHDPRQETARHLRRNGVG
jgi:chitin synthase